jgi:hypothetical protein
MSSDGGGLVVWTERAILRFNTCQHPLHSEHGARRLILLKLARTPLRDLCRASAEVVNPLPASRSWGVARKDGMRGTRRIVMRPVADPSGCHE